MKFINLISVGLALFMASASSSSQALIKNATALTSEEGKERCKEALDETYLNIDTENVVADIRLPYKGIYSTDITWTSNNQSVITIDTANLNGKISKMIGRVTRGSEDTKVALTATASMIDSGTTYTASKDFYVTVLKASSESEEELPLAFQENFASYLTGIDLSNYNKWQLTKGENGVAHVIHAEDLPNINNMVSTAALEVDSKKANADTAYEATINLKSPTSGSASAVLEGYMMFSGETNGVGIEFCSGSSTVSGIVLSSSSYKYMKSGKYTVATSALAEEGVWQKFRLSIRTSGYLIFQLYSWSEGKYIDVTKADANYINGGGVSSGTKGSLTSLKIRALSGKKIGKTFISDLKLDTAVNLPESGEVTNPNRKYGIGNITGYQSSILALKGETVNGIDPSKFNVVNRFNTSEAYVAGTDYSYQTVTNSSEDGSVVTYTHTFTLLKTMVGVSENEKKIITQTVYFDEVSNVGNISGFRASYLKKAYDDKGVYSHAYITLTGNVIRNDSTFYYVILAQGSAAPTQSQIVEATGLTGLADHGSSAITSSSFSFDTNALDITKVYDVYAVTKNATGISPIYKAESVSTKVNITTCEDLYNITNDKDTSESECVLLNDLDFASYQWAYDTGALKFNGVFNGNGHTISNLSISTPDSSLKVGLFALLGGTVKNVTFKDAYVAGFTDTGLLAGNLTDSAVISNVNFISCDVEQENTVSGGDGYFGIVGGRVRSGASITVNNINIKNNNIDCSQRTGLITGGVGDSNDTASISIKNVLATGTINTQNGASVGGLVGRNRGNVTVDNAVVDLDVKYAKKEVAAVVGKHEKGTLNVSNFVGDLKVEAITQSNYFNQFIGTVSPSEATYTASNVTFFSEDYSNLGDSIAYNKNAIDLGNHVLKPESFTKEWWETNTFMRDIDTSLIWQLDGDNLPEVKIRAKSDIAFTTADFISMVNKIDSSKILANHYYIYKAYDIFAFLSDTDKTAVSTQYSLLEGYKKSYDETYQAIQDINTSLDGMIGQN